MKKTQLKKRNSKLSQKTTLQRSKLQSLKNTPMLKKTSIEKTTQKQPISIKDLYKSLDVFLESNNWKNLRLIGLDLFSKVVFILAEGKCQKCGKCGTDAHHWCYTKSSNSITDIMPLNGILLCRKCHSEAHNDFNGFKERISSLTRYENAIEQLRSVVDKPIDFDQVKEILKTELQLVKDNENLLKKRKGEENGY